MKGKFAITVGNQDKVLTESDSLPDYDTLGALPYHVFNVLFPLTPSIFSSFSIPVLCYGPFPYLNTAPYLRSQYTLKMIKQNTSDHNY